MDKEQRYQNLERELQNEMRQHNRQQSKANRREEEIILAVEKTDRSV
ncbi:MAG: hypothetical protein K2M91_14910 [Lachnospiraceae bacterium]|nr:hypothetical protein [Lachnospiraceae bacterium]